MNVGDYIKCIVAERIDILRYGMEISLVLGIKKENKEIYFQITAVETMRNDSPFTFEQIHERRESIEEASELYEMIKTKLEDEEYTLDEENLVIIL